MPGQGQEEASLLQEGLGIVSESRARGFRASVTACLVPLNSTLLPPAPFLSSPTLTVDRDLVLQSFAWPVQA